MSKIARRTFIKGTAAVTAGAFLHTSRDAAAQDMAKADPESQAAQALKYTHDASTVDPADIVNEAPDQSCANCMFIQGNEGDEWRPCPLFPAQVVAAAGWCNAWQPKP